MTLIEEYKSIIKQMEDLRADLESYPQELRDRLAEVYENLSTNNPEQLVAAHDEMNKRPLYAVNSVDHCGIHHPIDHFYNLDNARKHVKNVTNGVIVKVEMSVIT
ncbi:hypothetical protein phiOC_p126 [Ochrobactrum phage vB_OspM_OC]|nr:hypothetical protein phiOC_p126 [Ochrobactrum phage vB_OspM_OC]